MLTEFVFFFFYTPTILSDSHLSCISDALLWWNFSALDEQQGVSWCTTSAEVEWQNINRECLKQHKEEEIINAHDATAAVCSLTLSLQCLDSSTPYCVWIIIILAWKWACWDLSCVLDSYGFTIKMSRWGIIFFWGGLCLHYINQFQEYVTHLTLNWSIWTMFNERDSEDQFKVDSSLHIPLQ